MTPAALTGCGSAGPSDLSSPARSTGSGDSRRQRPLPAASNGRFTDVTLAAGIEIRHRLPTADLKNIVDSLGGGAAFSDLDGDGWLDLIILGGPRSPEPGATADSHAGLRVYRNLHNGRFRDVTAASGIDPDSSGVAVAVADIDADGDRDLYLVDRGPNRLYRNRGDGSFEDFTRQAGVGDPRFGAGAVFLDVEGDGDLDLYVTNYLRFDPHQTAYFGPDGFPGPLSYESQADVLYRNRGDGTYEDISAWCGIDTLSGRGMSLATADFDDDGDTDIFVANDATGNFLLVNDGRGCFEDRGLAAGVAMGENGEQTAAMASDVGDVDRDGRLDLVVSDTAYGAFYRCLRPGLFVDEVMRSGLARSCGQYVSWGQNLIDYDNDGDLDLFVVNGGLHHLVGWEDLLLRNLGSGSYEDASATGGPYFEGQFVGRSSIKGDYDNDGDLDLLITTLQGRPYLLRNDTAPDLHWIVLDLVGRRVRDPFGARVRLVAGDGESVAELRCPSTYLGQSDPRLHFGLGRGIETVDRIEIRWPSGTTRRLEQVPAGRVHEIQEAG